MLHVMADLVGDHVGLREIARRLETVLQFVEEGQVDIHLAVAGAVERPHGRLAGAAGRGRGAAEQHQLGRHVLAVQLFLENGGPDVFGFAQHLRHEDGLGVIGGRARGGLFLLRGGAFRHLQDHVGIDTKIHGDQGKYYRTDPDGAASADPRAPGAAVFNIVAFARVIEAHTVSPGGSASPPFCIAARLSGLQEC
ncbi:hypothetical protein D3C72_1274250 [compost metagenome]